MPIIGLSLDATRDYESIYDSAKGTPEATVFTLGTLDSRVFGLLKDMAASVMVDPTSESTEVHTSINSNDVAFQTVCFGLKNWENFQDDKGKAIRFKKKSRNLGAHSYMVADPDLVRLIPEAIISELAEQIRLGNELSQVEAKN